MNILYFSQYSEENISIARHLCKNGYSFACFWENEQLRRMNVDFMATGFQSDPFFDKVFALASSPSKIDMVDKIKTMIIHYSFTPDAVVFRGELSELWTIAALKFVGEITCPCIAIMDNLPEDMKEEEKEILDIYDEKIILSENMFSKYNPKDFINYKDLNIPINLLDNNEVLVLANSNNFKKITGDIKNNKEFISIIDIENLENKDVCLYANASKIIVDATDNPETKLVLSKMGKKVISYSYFNINNIKFKKSYDFLERYKFFMSYFSNSLKEEIIQKIKNLKDKRDLSVQGKIIEI